MGCGQSKIGIYQRKSKSKKNGNKRTGEGGESEEETEEGEDRVGADGKGPATGDEADGEVASQESLTSAKIKQVAQQQQQQQQPSGGAILAQSDISSSQLDFFKMLDEKIESGPDYEGDDEEEEKARLENLLQEWKAASMARQLRKTGPPPDQEKWSSPARTLTYADEYGAYPIRGVGPLDTQRFPTGYSPCPPNPSIGIHLQNTFRTVAPPYPDQPRLQPRPPYPYHPYPPPTDPMNHCEDGHPLSTSEPPNPLHVGPYGPMRPAPHHYPENQRLYPGQYPDSPRAYPVEPRSYTLPRVMPTVNVLHEQRMYLQDGRAYPERLYPAYPTPEPQPQPRLLPDSQRLYHDRLVGDVASPGQRQFPPFQRPPLVAQRSFQEPPRMYRDLDPDECYQGRFDGDGPGAASPSPSPRAANLKMGRSASVDVQYVAGPPPPREMIPLQGAPGPPQGSPRPLTARGLQMTMHHRLPSNSVVQFRKSRGAFTELA